MHLRRRSVRQALMRPCRLSALRCWPSAEPRSQLGLTNLGKFVTLDAYQPSASYRARIGSAAVVSPDMQFCRLESRALTHTEQRKLKLSVASAQPRQLL
jgi:hypothetical protein